MGVWKKQLKEKILVILGPTATGKTDLALNLAKQFNGELIACDSRQVYKGLDIGTGKLPGDRGEWKVENERWVIGGIPIYMYDVSDPKIQYTVKDYVVQSEKVIEDILNRGKLPIIVGGTGLYLKALLDGLSNLSVPFDPKLRAELSNLSLTELQEKLKKLSLKRWIELNNSDQNNPRRLTRSIELQIMNPYIEGKRVRVKSEKWDQLKVGLIAPRGLLRKRISARLISRLNQGMIEEAEKLRHQGLNLTRMKELGLEYKYLALHLEGVISKEEMTEQLKIKIYQYAKRQLTWFKKEKNINWFDITGPKWESEVENRITNWYHSDTND